MSDLDTTDPPGWAPGDGPGQPLVLEGYSDFTLIAETTHSRVYTAVRRLPDGLKRRTVAVKELRDGGSRSRPLREAQLTLDLQHSSIIPVYDVLTATNGATCIMMEYCRRGSLAAENRQLTVAETLAAGIAVAEALEYAHRKGVLHRDIKPDNVLVRGDVPERPSSYVLTDFGIARQVNANLTNSTNQFTYPYASPQQLTGKPPSVADDVWSLGATLFTLLDGAPPFALTGVADTTDTLTNHTRRIENAEPRAMRRTDVPDALVAVISRCLHKDPTGRYADAVALRAALSAVVPAESAWARPGVAVPALAEPAPHLAPSALANVRPEQPPTGVPATPESDPQPVPRRKRRRWLALVAAAATVLVGVPVGVLLARGGEPNPSAVGARAGSPTGSSASRPAWAPELLDVTDQQSGAALLWLDHSTGRAGFIIVAEPDGRTGDERGHFPPGTTKAAVTGLDPLVHRYCFAVVAVLGGEHAVSEPRCVTRARAG
ncbi:serine/threonine-protein kinase [Longispora fulva]|uniref:non-specific serine/threonine protein kinase n=1 Tax=Longispora fulva TaxID=619741 RepID=A0A8J7KP61_9ACTN|nr:serine/threonine-protein kinase [Longispora fulva]MBG6135942.1 hypothetical protein [Longispora fulva]